MHTTDRGLRALLAAGILAVMGGPAWGQVADHLKCYQMKDVLNLGGTVDLDTPQFGVDPGCKISKAKLLCVPGTKTNVAVIDKKTKLPIPPLPFAGVSQPGDQICYKVTCPKPTVPIADQAVTDQFGTRTLTKFKASFVCTPAVKGSAYCGDGVKNGSEQCDGSDAAACPDACRADCTCPTPRFVDNGNGTITDNETGLQWEKKTTAVGSGSNYDDPHDVDNVYSWSASGTAANGTVFTEFLTKLNTPPCFADHCDWRLPSEEGRWVPGGLKELEGIVDMTAIGCGSGNPCIDPVFGPTVADPYWSLTTSVSDAYYAWLLHFYEGVVYGLNKDTTYYVRAVRTGS